MTREVYKEPGEKSQKMRSQPDGGWKVGPKTGNIKKL